MKIALTYVVDIDDDTEIGTLRDLREHIAIAIERRREVRHVADVHVTLDLQPGMRPDLQPEDAL